MKSKNTKTEKRIRIKRKIRMKVRGKDTLPRLSVFRSNRFIYAQLINDEKGTTIAGTSDLAMKKGTKTERAEKVGGQIAEMAKEKKISAVVFDRNGFKYTGRVKLLADAARKGGLKF